MNPYVPMQSSSKRLEFQEIEGLGYAHIPLRLTQQEWKMFCDPWGTGKFKALAYHPRFIISAFVAWYEDWDYCDVYEVALRYRPDRYRQFGPHKTPGLAKRKALNFLIERRCIELLPSKEGERGHLYTE